MEIPGYAAVTVGRRLNPDGIALKEQQIVRGELERVDIVQMEPVRSRQADDGINAESVILACS